MSNSFGQRRAEIMAFLNALTEREKLVALTHLCNDAAIAGRIEKLDRLILNMHRAHHRIELLELATQGSTLDLALLARRKGCRLERVPGDRWRVIPPADCSARLSRRPGRVEIAAVPATQALDLLRSLPDRPLAKA
jgi:hypothetical protein